MDIDAYASASAMTEVPVSSSTRRIASTKLRMDAFWNARRYRTPETNVPTAPASATRSGTSVRPAAEYPRTRRSVKPCAAKESEKRATAAEGKRVSVQSKAPEPKTTRTICARKTTISAIAGRDQNKTCRAAIATCLTNSFFWPPAYAAANVGNAATEYEAPIIERGTLFKLNANMKTAMDPGASVAARAVRPTNAI